MNVSCMNGSCMNVNCMNVSCMNVRRAHHFPVLIGSTFANSPTDYTFINPPVYGKSSAITCKDGCVSYCEWYLIT